MTVVGAANIDYLSLLENRTKSGRIFYFPIKPSMVQLLTSNQHWYYYYVYA